MFSSFTAARPDTRPPKVTFYTLPVCLFACWLAAAAATTVCLFVLALFVFLSLVLVTGVLRCRYSVRAGRQARMQVRSGI